MNGLAVAAGLIIMNVGLYWLSRNRYQMSLQTIEQTLFESLQQDHEEKIRVLQNEQNETVLQISAKRVETERKRIETLLADLAQRFDALSERLDGQNAQKTEQVKARQLSVETRIADLERCLDALTSTQLSKYI